MKTLDLHEAAHFLRMHPEEVRRRAKEGRIPGPKRAGRGSLLMWTLSIIYVHSMLKIGKRCE
jgi:hypothetical protein